jgi:sugar lactone lactonase YvrE
VPAVAQAPKETSAKGTAIASPGALARDNKAHLFVAQTYGDAVRRPDLRTKTMSTVEGNGKPCCYREGAKATEVSLDFPRALAVDASGNLFIAEGGVIRKADMEAGLISTFPGHTGVTKEGPSIEAASFQRITSLAIVPSGDVYIADDIQGKVFKTRVAGSGEKGFSGDGGPALNAAFHFVESIALDRVGNLYIADAQNCRIRRVDYQTGLIDTVAITDESKQSCPPESGTNPRLPSPSDLAVAPDDNLYFLEPAMNVVVRLDKAGNLSTVAGTSGLGFSGDGASATGAQMSGPTGLAIDSNGNLLFSDCRNNRIRGVDARSRLISTIVGNGFPHTIQAEE